MAPRTGSLNPKHTVIRQICGKFGSTARRYFGELGRAQPSPTTALAMRDDMERSLAQIIHAELSRSNLPVVMPTDATPTGDHWLFEPLAGRRNALHARLPFSTGFAYVREDGTCTVGGVYFPLEDVLVLVEAGQGSSGGSNHIGDRGDVRGRFRVAGRTDLTDGMLLLPWHTGDVITHRLLEKAEAASMHTRKTGHALFDAIDVAAGRADVIVTTRLNRLEALLAPLILSESGAFVSDFDGKAPTPSTTNLVAANPKLHGQALKLLRG